MAIVYEFGTAPEAAKLGYKVDRITYGSTDSVCADHFGKDVILVRGAYVGSGEPGRYEFAVMVPDHIGDVTGLVL